jgi:hypothetical protein
MDDLIEEFAFEIFKDTLIYKYGYEDDWLLKSIWNHTGNYKWECVKEECFDRVTQFFIKVPFPFELEYKIIRIVNE